jgi:hypothetical protein
MTIILDPPMQEPAAPTIDRIVERRIAWGIRDGVEH